MMPTPACTWKAPASRRPWWRPSSKRSSGRLRPEQQKELLRGLIRRVILTRPVPDEVHIKIVWISGAVSPLVIHPRLLRTVTLGTYPQFVQRVLALAAEGYLDAAIAQML